MQTLPLSSLLEIRLLISHLSHRSILQLHHTVHRSTASIPSKSLRSNHSQPDRRISQTLSRRLTAQPCRSSSGQCHKALTHPRRLNIHNYRANSSLIWLLYLAVSHVHSQHSKDIPMGSLSSNRSNHCNNSNTTLKPLTMLWPTTLL